MKFNFLLLEISENIAVVKLNRPDKLNALNIELIEELKHLFISLKNNEDVHVVIITGSGEKAFAAGADISEINKLNQFEGKTFSVNGQEVFNLIDNLGKPVLAAVNGFALGGGFELALSCHIRFASENAKFALPEVTLGVIPGFGGTQRLTKLINSGRAAEYILTGQIFDAADALQMGIINKIFPLNELLPQTIKLAAKIASKPQLAVRYALEAIKKAETTLLKEGLAFEASLFSLSCGTEDFKEGTSAFLEKRPGIFKNK